MRTGICLQLAHLIVLSSSAIILGTSNQEFFCLRTKYEFGRSQCTFLRRSSVSILLYLTIWTADCHVEECSISAEPTLIQNYISVCHEEHTWGLQKTSSLCFNISLSEPGSSGSPCKFRTVSLSNFKMYFKTNYQVNSGFRVRQKRAWILPGTLWCGQGSRAGEYEQLGMFERVDRCCREHDHCDHIIRPFTVNFGIFNPTLFTLSHCNCDHRFKQCLLDINDTISNMVGYTFFNLLQPYCFELIQERRCTKMNWIGMCTSDNVAPYAVLKHSTIYNATTVNIGTSKPHTKPSSTTKRKSMKPKERKKSQKSHALSDSSKQTVVLGEVIGQSYSTTQPISLLSNIQQPKCQRSCNTTSLHQKSKLLQKQTAFLTAAGTVHVRTSSIKGKPLSIRSIIKNGRNITQWSNTTVQTDLVNKYNLSKMTPNLNRGPTRADNFTKHQRRKNDTQDKVALHTTVSQKYFTLSVTMKLQRNKFIENTSKTKKEKKSSNRKNIFNRLISRSQPQTNRRKIKIN